MTRYRITYKTKGRSKEATGSIVERTERRAKKLLGSMLREEGTPLDYIESIEVEQENVPATKAQEREALEEIKAIVDSLGEQSYLRTAFDGCFEDAENNIDDDAAYSMKDRWESAERKLAEAQAQIKTMELDNRNLRLQIDHIKQVAARTEKQLKDKTLSDEDLAGLDVLISEAINDVNARLDALAQDIVWLADDPTAQDFINAVTEHRAMTNKLNYYTARRNHIIRVREAGA